MSLKHRDYQTKMLDESEAAHEHVRCLLHQLATGGGKTIIFSSMCHRDLLKDPNTKILIVVHRKKLLKQTRTTLYNLFGINAAKITSDSPTIPVAKVYVGMAETVWRRMPAIQKLGIKRLIVDEVHEGIFKKIIKSFTDCLISAFSATPIATDKKDPLKNYFHDIIVGVDIEELIALNQRENDQGLVQNITRSPKDVVDRAQLALKGGEFDVSTMAAQFGKTKHIKNTVKYYEEYARGTKTIVFNCNIDHSKKVTQEFLAAGYDCKHFDSEMSQAEQEHVLKWFKHTPGAIICSIGILTTGFDEPTIETVIVNRSTTSLTLWLQMCGRGSRPCVSIGKHYFTIIDLGGNAIKLGDWNDPYDWLELFWNPPAPGKPKDIPPPKKSCPACESIIPAPATVCKFCGYKYPLPEDNETPYIELIVVTKGIDVPALMKKNKNKAKWYTFYEISKEVARAAKTTTKEMTDEIYGVLYDQAMIKITEWAASHYDKVVKYHRDETHKTLTNEIKKRFPNWQVEKQSTGTDKMGPYDRGSSGAIHDEQLHIHNKTSKPQAQPFSPFDGVRFSVEAFKPIDAGRLVPVEKENGAKNSPVITPKPGDTGSIPNFIIFTAP